MNQEDQSTSPSSVKQAHRVCHCPWLKSHHLAWCYLCKRRRGREVCVGRNHVPFHIIRFHLWHLGLDVNSSPVQSHITMMRQISDASSERPPSRRPLSWQVLTGCCVREEPELACTFWIAKVLSVLYWMWLPLTLIHRSSSGHVYDR